MMTVEQIKDHDRKWFQDHRGERAYIRRAFDSERALGPEWLLVVVTQIEPGKRYRSGLSVPEELIEYVLRHGLDCIADHCGRSYMLLPPSVVNGRTLA
jgi:hypothetical protein